MSRYQAEYRTDPERAAEIARRAGAHNGIPSVWTQPAPDTVGRIVKIEFEAPDNYTARSTALFVQGATAVRARIKQASLWPTPWYDLNEGEHN